MDTDQINLLLADDDNDDCLMFKEILSDLPLPFSLAIVHDGEKLMETLSKKGEKLPDLLFLDLNMPRKNGFECLTEIKLDKKIKQLPVIVLSTSFDQNIANLLYKNGAQYYIRKPAGFSAFKKVIHYAILETVKNNFIQSIREKFVITGDLKTSDK